MKEQLNREETVKSLQKEIMEMQGMGKPSLNSIMPSIGPIQNAFPNQMIPVDAVHEFISNNPEVITPSITIIFSIAPLPLTLILL